MSSEEIRAILARHRTELERLDVASLELFGSTAREEADPDSDLDVLVSFRGPATFDHYRQLRFLLEDLLRRRIDLVTRRSLRPEIAPRVEKDAVRVA